MLVQDRLLDRRSHGKSCTTWTADPEPGATTLERTRAKHRSTREPGPARRSRRTWCEVHDNGFIPESHPRGGLRPRAGLRARTRWRPSWRPRSIAGRAGDPAKPRLAAPADLAHRRTTSCATGPRPGLLISRQADRATDQRRSPAPSAAEASGLREDPARRGPRPARPHLPLRCEVPRPDGRRRAKRPRPTPGAQRVDVRRGRRPCPTRRSSSGRRCPADEYVKNAGPVPQLRARTAPTPPRPRSRNLATLPVSVEPPSWQRLT